MKNPKLKQFQEWLWRLEVALFRFSQQPYFLGITMFFSIALAFYFIIGVFRGVSLNMKPVPLVSLGAIVTIIIQLCLNYIFDGRLAKLLSKHKEERANLLSALKEQRDQLKSLCGKYDLAQIEATFDFNKPPFDDPLANPFLEPTDENAPELRPENFNSFGKFRLAVNAQTAHLNGLCSVLEQELERVLKRVAIVRAISEELQTILYYISESFVSCKQARRIKYLLECLENNIEPKKERVDLFDSSAKANLLAESITIKELKEQFKPAREDIESTQEIQIPGWLIDFKP